MKDKELRREVDKRFTDIGRGLDELGDSIEVWEKAERAASARADLDVSIRGCGKCGHDTLHERHPKPLYYSIHWGDGEKQTETFHRCLNCGTDWVYNTETVAREYKPVKCGRDRKKKS